VEKQNGSFTSRKSPYCGLEWQESTVVAAAAAAAAAVVVVFTR
jgi:hypothetical protein